MNLRVNYGCVDPLLFKREKMKMQSREQASQDVQVRAKLCARAQLRAACGAWGQHTLGGWPHTGRPVGTTLEQSNPKTCQVKGTPGEKGEAPADISFLPVLSGSWLMR